MRPLLLMTAALAATAMHAGAQPQRAAAALVAGWAETGGGRIAGLSITLAPGWKTYWRAPGESGLPPAFDWSGSTNLAAITVEWPAPQVFDSFGMTTLGYDGEVVLPLRVTPADPAKPVGLRLGLDYGVCADICIPARADLALDIAPGAPAEAADRVAAHRARTPRHAREGGVTRAECGVAGAGASRDFTARLNFAQPPAQAPVAVVVEGPEGVWFAPAEASLRDGALLVSAAVEVWGGSGWIARDALRLTLIDADGAVEIDGCVAPQG